MLLIMSLIFYFYFFSFLFLSWFGFNHGQINEIVAYLRVLQAHMLCHRSLSPIWFLAIRYWTYIFSLDFIGAPSDSSLFFFSRIFFFTLQGLYQMVEIFLFLLCGFQLSCQHRVSEMKLISFFFVKKSSTLHVSLELIDRNGLLFCELVVVPIRVALEVVFLPLEQTFFDVLPCYILHLFFMIH